MRLFVAACPPQRVVEALNAVARAERPGLRWAPSSQWHVTLRFFGDAEIEEGVAVGQRVAEAAAFAQPAVAELGPLLDGFGSKVLYVPVSGLDTLATTLERGTADLGEPPRPSPFVGHITLARNRGKDPLDDLTGTPISGSWNVDEIALVASVLAGQPGVPNRHEVVATFPLGSPA